MAASTIDNFFDTYEKIKRKNQTLTPYQYIYLYCGGIAEDDYEVTTSTLWRIQAVTNILRTQIAELGINDDTDVSMIIRLLDNAHNRGSLLLSNNLNPVIDDVYLNDIEDFDTLDKALDELRECKDGLRAFDSLFRANTLPVFQSLIRYEDGMLQQRFPNEHNVFLEGAVVNKYNLITKVISDAKEAGIQNSFTKEDMTTVLERCSKVFKRLQPIQAFVMINPMLSLRYIKYPAHITLKDLKYHSKGVKLGTFVDKLANIEMVAIIVGK